VLNVNAMSSVSIAFSVSYGSCSITLVEILASRAQLRGAFETVCLHSRREAMAISGSVDFPVKLEESY
jgi:hypothetical protein